MANEIAPKIYSWEQKKENLYKKIDNKIQSIINIKHLAYNIKDCGLDDMEKIFDQKIDLLKNELNEDELKKIDDYLFILEKIQKIETEIVSLDRAIGNKPMEYWSEDRATKDDLYAVQKVEELEDESMRLLESIKNESNDETIFLGKIKIFFNGILNKKRQVINLKNQLKINPKEFFQTLSNYGYDLEKDYDQGMVKFIFSGYSLNIIIKNDLYEEIVNDFSVGMHCHGSAINIINGEDENIEKTIRHEENHSLSESFIQRDFKMSEIIFNCIEKNFYDYEKLLSEDQSIPEIKQKIEYIENKFSKEILNFSHYYHSELIADIDDLGEGQISTIFYEYKGFIDKIEGLKCNRPESVRLIGKLLKNTNEQFSEYFKKLSDIFYTSKKVNKLEESKAAILLFEPKGSNTKMERIRKYLIYLDDKFEAYEILKNIISPGSYFKQIENELAERGKNEIINIFFHDYDKMQSLLQKSNSCYFFKKENVYKLSEILDKNDEKNIIISPEEGMAIIENIDNISVHDIIKLIKENNFLHISEIISYDDEIKNIAKKIGCPQMENFVEEKFSYWMFDLYYNNCIMIDNFQNLAELYTSWPFDKTQMNDYIKDLLKDGYIYKDYEEKLGKNFNHQTIKDSNFFIFLKNIEADIELEKFLT
jgi:hypothetical protein